MGVNPLDLRTLEPGIGGTEGGKVVLVRVGTSSFAQWDCSGEEVAVFRLDGNGRLVQAAPLADSRRYNLAAYLAARRSAD